MPFKLSPLPFAHNSLTPFISRKTVHFHYNKHHAGYLDNLNKLTQGSDWANLSLEDIILTSSKDTKNQQIFNNAAQVWNHDFYWRSLTPPNFLSKPDEALQKSIIQSFGSLDNLKLEIKNNALSLFGSGWVWLIKEQKQLKIIKTSNAFSPLLVPKSKALLTIDVWEHAYYLDYQNKRGDYIQEILNHLLNWNFAVQNFHQS